MVVAQIATREVAVVATIVPFALFLSLTVHIAARNVLGDVPARKALLVGPVPAVVAVVTAALGVPALVGLAVAVVLDGAVVAYVYGPGPRLSAYITVIHFAVSVLLGAVVFGLLLLINTVPG
ncbi:MAG: hypothetical protein ABEJ28_02060 [Salinigranum sp.]